MDGDEKQRSVKKVRHGMRHVTVAWSTFKNKCLQNDNYFLKTHLNRYIHTRKLPVLEGVKIQGIKIE